MVVVVVEQVSHSASRTINVREADLSKKKKNVSFRLQNLSFFETSKKKSLSQEDDVSKIRLLVFLRKKTRF